MLETAAREKAALLTAARPETAGYLATHPDVADQLAYLTRAVQEGGDIADQWFDALVEHTAEILVLAEERGAIIASADPTGRAVVLTAQSLATLLLRSYLARHLGNDPFTDPETYDRLTRVVTELRTNGLLTTREAEPDD